MRGASKRGGGELGGCRPLKLKLKKIDAMIKNILREGESNSATDIG